MKISVLITCFNYREYVEQAINSALSQSLAPNEIIVVDDGSTDGSAQLVKERFGHKENIQIVTTPNRGHVAAICEGFLPTTGDNGCSSQVTHRPKLAAVGKPVAIVDNGQILLATVADRLGRRSNAMADDFVDRLAGRAGIEKFVHCTYRSPRTLTLKPEYAAVNLPRPFKRQIRRDRFLLATGGGKRRGVIAGPISALDVTENGQGQGCWWNYDVAPIARHLGVFQSAWQM